MATHAILTGPTAVPGVVDTPDYSSGDAFGTIMTFNVPNSTGVIHGALWIDLGNIKIQKDVFLFSALPSDTTADNAAWDPPDADMASCIGAFSIGAGDYFAAANSAIGCVRGLNLPYVTAGRKVYARIVTRGADNLAASNLPSFGLYVI